MNQVNGIDISHWSTVTDFAAIKNSGVQFVYLKCTEGIDNLDGKYLEYSQACIAQGLLQGAYHFFHPSMDPIVQAKHFLANVNQAVKNPLPYVLDWEASSVITNQQNVANAQVFLNYVQSQTGQLPMIYGGYYYLNPLNLSESFSKYPLWLAAYNSTPKLPGIWKSWTFWQYSQSSSIPGVSGKCDVNYFNGSLQDLYNLIGLTPNITPPKIIENTVTTQKEITMGVATDQLVGVLKKLEAADLPILVSSLLPALEETVNSLLPASAGAVAGEVEALFNPAIQSALAALVAKIPVS